MKLNPKLPLSDKFMARIAAQAIVFHHFNLQEAVGELRPDIVDRGQFANSMMNTPEVQREIEVIMNRTERDGSKFIKTMWDALERYETWIADPALGPPPKHMTEVAQTAMRLLARGYIGEKRGKLDVPATQPMVIDGMSAEALTGEVKGKVM